MRTFHFPAIALALMIFGLAFGTAVAQEPPLRFLHALQENGYGDIAVEYMGMMEKRPDLPKEIRDVWDLEMSKSLKSAAGAALDEKDAAALLEKSQTFLDKFIKEKPDHPEAIVAMESWGDFLMKRALESLTLAKSLEGKEPEKAQYEKYLTDARTGLTNARDKFQQADKKCRAQLAALPAPSKLPTKQRERGPAAEAREKLLTNLQDIHLQLALAEYYLAQTYSDPKCKERIDGLQIAAKLFDAVYQVNRESTNYKALYAHMWHGKAAEELGDFTQAIDIYDEVLTRIPDPQEKGADTLLEPFFTKVQHFRLIIVGKQQPAQFLSEADDVLKEYSRLIKTEGYQGIALDAAKAKLAAANKATGPDKKKLMNELLKLVTECSKVRSPYQQELVLLRRDVLKASNQDVEATSFQEAVVAGDIAAESQEWQNALDTYQKALDMAKQPKQKVTAKEIAAVHEAMGRVQYRIACDLFNKSKFTECKELISKIVLDDKGEVKKDSEAAAKASALSVSAALNMYEAAPSDKRPAALEEVVKAAEFTVKHWPDSVDADEARIALGQAKGITGKVREGIEVFERVSPRPEHYPTAMYLAGKQYYKLYLDADKAKTGGAPDTDAMKADRAKAIERLTSAVESVRKQYVPGKPMPKYMLEAPCLLGEIRLQGGEAKEAVAIYQPLVEIIKAEKSQTFDEDTKRVFLGAVKAYTALNDIDKAAEVGNVLIELGPDTLPVNDGLIGFARLLDKQRREADAVVIELKETTKAEELSAAEKRLATVQDLLGKVLIKLSQRKEFGVGNMMFLGETLSLVGMTDEASEQFKKILQRVETDPAFAEQAKKAMSRIRTDLLKTLRMQEKYEDALKQVDQLIKDNPRALEPMMERGRILEAWAEKNPAKYADAVDNWAKLRSRLAGTGMKKKPDEYYEVNYYVANCLVREAEKISDKAKKAERANMAEKVLNSTLVQSPNLSGPDMVAKYKALRNRAIILQGRSPDEKGEKKP